jgi:hypothetical protein
LPFPASQTLAADNLRLQAAFTASLAASSPGIGFYVIDGKLSAGPGEPGERRKMHLPAAAA